MNAPIPAPLPTVSFSRDEWQALRTLRVNYLQDRDLFSDRERARLRFLRWLYQTGALVP